ncbi:MAG: hypothetical protein KDA42_13080, partial [Planctomycetales bacterium]|nr:hypothetical protein [Planctomycetales bacterium]
SSPEARYQGLAHTEFLSFGTDFSSIAALVEKTTWTGWPDVFDPRFERFCELRARQRCAPHRQDPWLLGYFLDNELEWWGKSHRPWGLVEETIRLPANAAGKQALVASLRRSFLNNVDQFNDAFGTKLEDFDSLLPPGDLPKPQSDAARDALDRFIVEAAERYFQVTTAAVRRHDPNHLILGCRFAFNAPDAAWRQAGATCDVVTVNVYPRIDLKQRRVITLDEHLQSKFDLCGRPMIVTEWSFPALDAFDSMGHPLPSQHGAGMRVDTQAQRAQCFAIMQQALAKLPFIVGSHYFMWADEPALGIRSTFPEDSNYGLVSEADVPYPEITEAAAVINARLPALHAGDCEVLAWKAAELSGERISPSLVEAGELRLNRDGENFTIINGPLRLEHQATGGAAFQQIFRRNDDGKWIELGRYQVTLFQTVRDQNHWPRAEYVAKVDVREESPQRLVIDMEFHNNASPAWKAAYRFRVLRGRPWFTAQALWIENCSDTAWNLGGYYHYLPSNLGGDSQDDDPGGPNVPNYYRPLAAWRDARLPWLFGAIALGDDERCSLRFWKDGDGQHPDAQREVDRLLAPGARWTAAADEPEVTIFGLRTTPENPRPWLAIADDEAP